MGLPWKRGAKVNLSHKLPNETKKLFTRLFGEPDRKNLSLRIKITGGERILTDNEFESDRLCTLVSRGDKEVNTGWEGDGIHVSIGSGQYPE